MDEKATNFHTKRVAFFYDIALIYSDVAI